MCSAAADHCIELGGGGALVRLPAALDDVGAAEFLHELLQPVQDEGGVAAERDLG